MRQIMRGGALIAFLGLLWLLPQAVTAIRAQILDTKGKPIESVFVTDKRSFDYSDSQGFFQLDNPADSLYFSRIGYDSITLSRHRIGNTIVMQSQEIVLPTVWVKAELPPSPSLGAELIYPDTNAPAMGVADLLQESSAFGSTDLRLTGERQTVSILGNLGRHSLVLMDNVVISSSGEAFDLGKIPLNQVDYIEIIKGNASAYGGSSAIGGIIHIHSKKAANQPAWEAELKTGVGSFGMWSQSIGGNVQNRRFSLAGEYSYYDALNDFPYPTPEYWQVEDQTTRTHNRKQAHNLFLKTGYNKEKLQLDYSLNAGWFDRELPGPINFLELYDDAEMVGGYQQHKLHGTFAMDAYTQEYSLWLNNDSNTYRNLQPTLPINRGNYTQNQTNQGLRMGNILAYNNTQLGLDLEVQRYNYEFINRLSGGKQTGNRDNAALAMKVQQLTFPFTLMSDTRAAFRLDYGSRLMNATWRLEEELKLPTNPQITMGGYVGTGFSRPSFYDMYWIGDSQTQGNPDLKNEKSLGYNLYTLLNSGSSFIKLAWYQNWVEELIQWRQYYLNGMSWKPFNVGNAQISNLEVEAKIPLDKLFTLAASFTKTKAIDKSKSEGGTPASTYNKVLVYTPDYKAGVELAFHYADYGASLRYGYTGKQYSTMDNLIDPLDAFDNLNAGIYWMRQIRGVEVNLNLKLNNILDNHYEIYAATPQPGFNWTAGLNLSYKMNKGE